MIYLCVAVLLSHLILIMYTHNSRYRDSSATRAILGSRLCEEITTLEITAKKMWQNKHLITPGNKVESLHSGHNIVRML